MKSLFRILFFLFMIILVGISSVHAQSDNLIQQCQALEDEIKGMIRECQVCRTDGACFADTKTRMGCPFGCYFLRSYACNNGAKLILIENKIKEYEEKCPLCEYKCMMPPNQNDIGCIDEYCTDLRGKN